MAHSIPIGFERLMNLSAVNVKQKTTFSLGNKFVVTTPEDEVLYRMKEDKAALSVLLGGSNRSFHIDALDNFEKKVFSLRRPYQLMSDKVEVSVGGQIVSVVRREPTLAKPLFYVNDASNHPVLRIKGNSGYSHYVFKLQSINKQTIGYIKKKFEGFLTEMFTNYDSYEITFPRDLEARYKAAAIAACIVIDYRYHEK